MPPALPTRRRDLVARGVARDRLDHDLRTGRSRSVFRGVHVAAEFDGVLARLHAAIQTQHPGAVVSHRAAAVLLSLPWLPSQWSTADFPVDLMVAPHDKHRNRAGLTLHRNHLPSSHVVIAQGLPCTSPARTLLDLAAREPRLLSVTLIDGALRHRRCSRNDLLSALAGVNRMRGVRWARAAVDAAREGVDSPPETRLRLILADGGITGAEPGYVIRDDAGLVVARADLADPTIMVWGEYDGYATHLDRSTFRGDRVGDRWLARRGWLVLRFVDDDLRHPDRVVREWASARADAPARIAAMDPRRSPELRRALAHTSPRLLRSQVKIADLDA